MAAAGDLAHQISGLAGICVLFAVVITLCQIRMQIIWNSNQAMRKHVIRILMMVPVYGIQCYFALVVDNATIYFDALRECYEAVVIYSFVGLLIGFLGGERHLIYVMEQKPQDYVKHPFPANVCLGDTLTYGEDLFRFAKIGSLQYVVVKPITAVITIALQRLNIYGEEDLLRLDRGYIYIVIINSFSQAMAIYSLLLFYKSMSAELQPLGFIPKAIVLKSVIFFTYWQGIMFRLLYSIGLFPISLESENEMAQLLDLTLCIEMGGFAVAQWVAWGRGSEFFDENEKVTESYGSSLLGAANLGDLWNDAKEAVQNGEVKRLLKKKEVEAMNLGDL
mmetsp:Transcript_10091/g.18373  ORF Transcript_10091/g.18373 Transcript_10091/m.18373 type:complete len:335 (+) Transcript_10091:28-1032(+)